MIIADALTQIESIHIPGDAAPVYRTAAHELARAAAALVRVADRSHDDRAPGVFRMLPDADALPATTAEEAAWLRLGPDGSGFIAVTRPYLLFGFVSFLLRHLVHRPTAAVAEPARFPAAFAWQRVVYDYFLTQEGRIQRGLAPETYVRRLAEGGFTHIEVNGLASPMGLETGPRGEAYPMFYTYCPALDQFVSSRLNHGLYPDYYLSANLAALKRNAELARKYGLVPGLLCFEPRSVPEEFFARYPMLRGARVDHPFRSFKPRYNMTIAHPKVKEHYAQMMTALMQEVPELGFLSVWTNDSGAGFEHTSSLYVGRNGGPYLIREWKDHGEIARVAGENVLDFYRLLRDAARQVNPGFRLITRMEPFDAEHDVIWRGLRDGLEAEGASFIARGWEMPYTHPRYPDLHTVNGGSIYQAAYDDREATLAQELAGRSSRAHIYFSAGPHAMFLPLLGVPYPTLTARRLRLLHEKGVKCLAHLGGTHPPEQVPFNINHEILSAFQFDPDPDVKQTLARIAHEWAGAELATTLLEAWALAEEAILAFPNTVPLYSTIGFVWYRLWARPLVPNIEALPEEERAYYERFMCTTPHNPNNVDLSRDVLFRLTTPEDCRVAVERIDQNLWKPLDEAIAALDAARNEARAALGEGSVIEDQFVRLSALRCWFMTQRTVAAWIAGVHGWLSADATAEKQECRARLRDAMTREIDNSHRLAGLLDSPVEFMSLTDQGETPLVYGDNLKDLLPKRIALMEAHLDDEPYIDPDYIERRAGIMLD
jgi:hypothetical protein